MDIYKKYEDFCIKKNVPFKLDSKVCPYDDTTLFCPAGMQQFKHKFKDPDNSTIANIQSCLRLKDIDEIGDGSHLLYFNMIGLFSFEKMTLKEAVEFWIEFITMELNIKLDYITIHPDMFEEWKYLYEEHGVELRHDDECKWTDGEIGGYCTEFYAADVEIGNIVNTLGTCIDVGFGMERLEVIVNGTEPKSDIETLKETIVKIIDSGYKPGPQKQGYVLRKLLRELVKRGGDLEHEFFLKEKERQEKVLVRYERLKNKHKDKSKEWWYDTHGIDLDLIN
jgi:alanyl-tRNA synthetase